MNKIIKGEVWKEVVGYEGIYKISDRGRVLSLEREVKHKRTGIQKINERELKTYLEKNGYLRVVLSNEAIKKRVSVHRLVAETFIKNPENKKTVNHKNGIKSDNSVGNLEWATQSENVKHAWRTGLSKNTEKQRESARNSVGASKPVKFFDKKTGEITYFSSAVECSVKMNRNKNWCAKIINFHNGETKKYIAEYVKQRRKDQRERNKEEK